jgi:biopolymer transport protein ExbB/TolQ
MDLGMVYEHDSGAAWLMAMLVVAMAIVWLATVGARVWIHQRMRRHSRRFSAGAEQLLKAGQWGEVIALSQSKAVRHSPVARTVGPGLETWLSHKERGTDPLLAWQVTRASMSQCGDEQVAAARRGLRTLLVVGGTAPLAGFIGAAFELCGPLWAAATLGSSVAAGVAAGITAALPLPAFGLLVSLLALWSGAWLTRSAEKQRLEMGRAMTSVLDQLARQKPTNGNA